MAISSNGRVCQPINPDDYVTALNMLVTRIEELEKKLKQKRDNPEPELHTHFRPLWALCGPNGCLKGGDGGILKFHRDVTALAMLRLLESEGITEYSIYHCNS